MRLTLWLLAPAALAGLALGLPARADDAPPTKKELAASAKKLREIGLAMHSCADLNEGRLPADLTDKDGRAILSWRVTILPFVGEEALYKQFKLDEPWDGPNNKKLIEKMPKVFAPVRGKAKAGETYYQVFFGKDAVFGANPPPKFPDAFPDGTSNTALVVEGADPVAWTMPRDLPFNEKAPLPGLGGMFGGEFHVLLGDGSVIRVKKDFDQKMMKYVIMPGDGMVVDIEKLIKK